MLLLLLVLPFLLLILKQQVHDTTTLHNQPTLQHYDKDYSTIRERLRSNRYNTTLQLQHKVAAETPKTQPQLTAQLSTHTPLLHNYYSYTKPTNTSLGTNYCAGPTGVNTVYLYSLTELWSLQEELLRYKRFGQQVTFELNSANTCQILYAIW